MCVLCGAMHGAQVCLNCFVWVACPLMLVGTKPGVLAEESIIVIRVFWTI